LAIGIIGKDMRHRALAISKGKMQLLMGQIGVSGQTGVSRHTGERGQTRSLKIMKCFMYL